MAPRARRVTSPPPRGASPAAVRRRARLPVVVVVLGDFGRSPRMQYHALSLAEQAGREVHVVAYAGAAPHAAVASHPRITLHALREPPAALGALPRPLALVVKALLQLCSLLWALLVRAPAPSHYLLQTPPCVPALAACLLAAALRRARLVLDWHNFAYSLMALTTRSAPLLRLAEAYERRLGRAAHAHLCVTRAMAAELAQPGWGVRNAVVLHDRPARMFRGRATAREAHELLARLAPTLAASRAAGAADWAVAELAACSDARTVVTERAGARGAVTRRSDRPALVVSSTSWTPDEDFGLLLAALASYDRAASGASAAARALPRLLVVVTGSGPLRARYEAQAAAMALRRVAVRTAWLEAADYPRLLACADLGVSLHASSSGLDLPMKVVDMFGAGLPVAALQFPAIGELVQEGANGVLFADAPSLAEQLQRLLTGFGGDDDLEGDGTERLAKLRRGAQEWAATGWEDEWARHALPLFD